MTTAPGGSRVAVLGEYQDGVDAVVALTADLSADAWDARACGEWTVTQVGRHMLAVSGWYHAWLDRGVHGDATPPFPADALPARNEEELASLRDVSGQVAVERFATRAREYGERLRDAWDVPFGYPFGSVTAGLHAPVAAVEWHLHAWDVATATGRDHHPHDAATLLDGVVQCFAVAQGGVQGRLLTRFGPSVTRFGDPWKTLLRRSGRRPVRRSRRRT